jgi:hypothetical protein
MASLPTTKPGSDSSGQWEYRVVHINVDSGPPPQPPNPQTASEHLHGVLSPNFLAKEFPEHYGNESEAARRNRHPAEQLQTFLNLLGREGWEMTDSCQVGPLLMFFFKRPLRPAPKLIAAVRSDGPEQTATADAAVRGAPPDSPDRQDDPPGLAP